jgi:hypothetical protein
MLEGMLMVLQLQQFSQGEVDLILEAISQAVVEQVLEEMGILLVVGVGEETADKGFQAHYRQTLL